MDSARPIGRALFISAYQCTSDGTVAQRLDYDEYGRVTQNTAPGFQPFGYAGGLLDDATGLTRFGARDYDPVTGRWTAKDPMGFGAGDGNLYAYVGGNPISHIDPTGACLWDACIFEAALIGAGIGALTSFAIDAGLQYLQNGASFCNYDLGRGLQQAAFGAVLGGVTGGLGEWFTGARAAGTIARAGGGVSGASDVQVIGRQAETAAYAGREGYNVLNASNWTPAMNEAWIQSGINANRPFLLASDLSEANILSATNPGGFTVFGSEISQLMNAGYRYVGSYLLPPLP